MANSSDTQASGSLEHKSTIHTHDHWHVTHLHVGDDPNNFEHRSTYHSHEHSHAGYEFQADQPEEHSDESHPAKAHVHDHDTPTS